MRNDFSDLTDELNQIKKHNLYRSRRVISSPQGVDIEIDGKRLVNFSSNDYLGLANHPEIIKTFKKATDQYGVGSGSAHLICGHTAAHHALEEELAEFTGRDRALLFSTGYMANLGVISALLKQGDQVFEDRLNHASLLDGGLLSSAQFKRYFHNDVSDLKKKIRAKEGRKLFVTDGVFSMDGDIAPLSDLVELSKKNNAWVMVDDAHGIGVLGHQGGGVLQSKGFSQSDVPILMATLGKGLGTFGAFVAGSNELIETLIQKARTYIFTTALPAAVAEATRTSLKIAAKENWRREHLTLLRQRFCLGASQLNLQLMPSESAIQPLLVGESSDAMQMSTQLLKKGFFVGAIRPPTVPKDQARLRITFSAHHQEHHVDGLLDALSSLG